MTVKDMLSLLADLPENTVIEVFNGSAEWYGLEEMNSVAWKSIGNKLIFSFVNYPWDNHETEAYLAAVKAENERKLSKERG